MVKKKQDQRLLQGAMPEELVGNSSALSIPFILVSLHWRAQVSRANPLGLAFVTHCPLSSAVTRAGHPGWQPQPADSRTETVCQTEGAIFFSRRGHKCGTKSRYVWCKPASIFVEAWGSQFLAGQVMQAGRPELPSRARLPQEGHLSYPS